MNQNHIKHIFLTGGVVSSLGKGLTAASIALLLIRRGYRVSLQKLDPYLNVDPGTMSPYQHGEVYVTEDGAETDLDLGHYERFTETPCQRNSNFTAGAIYSRVIIGERKGEYLGKTIQVIPHITDEIQAAIDSLDNGEVDIIITEIGGTTGDIESLPFLEAIRQYRQKIGPKRGIFIHLTLLPYLKAAGELKTKPSQQSVGLLREIGIMPDILICRCEQALRLEHKEKLSLYCNLAMNKIIEERDVVHSIYEVPVELAKQNVDTQILKQLDLAKNNLELADWHQMLNILINPQNGNVVIAVVGKYISLQDAYKSIYEALTHGGIANSVKVSIQMIESEEIENSNAETYLEGMNGILIPGGFGHRGIEGKIATIQYARIHRIPFLGICLGMQCAVIEFARHVCHWEKANSNEFDPKTPYPVIHLMGAQRQTRNKGATMRLGTYPCELQQNTISANTYQKMRINERHRHRYEVNTQFRPDLEKNGMICAGLSPDQTLVEIIEIRDHPWFVACQFHPEFQSTPLNCHPFFHDFIRMAVKQKQQNHPIEKDYVSP